MANPILISSGATITGASIVPAVEWILSGCPHPVPESVSALVAAVIVAGIHAGIMWFNGRAQAKAPATPPAA